MTIAKTQNDRLALIKEIAERRKAEKKAERARQIKMYEIKEKAKKARSAMLQARKKRKDPLEALNVKDGENINQYTDQAKYAKTYYGETLYETTRYDNEWD